MIIRQKIGYSRGKYSVAWHYVCRSGTIPGPSAKDLRQKPRRNCRRSVKVKDLKPEHGEGFIGVGDVAVEANRTCRVLLDAPVFEADFRDVAPIIIRRTQDAGYEVQMGGLPDESNFALIPTPDVSTWVSVKVVSVP